MSRRKPRFDVVFCTEITDVAGQIVPDEYRQYQMFMHEAEVLMWALANAVEEEKVTAEDALKLWEPYRSVCPLDDYTATEFKSGFPDTDWLMDHAPGPGSEHFWRAAASLGIPGVFCDELNSPGGWPAFEVQDKRSLERVCEALRERYKVLVLDQEEYDTSSSSDVDRAQRIIETGREAHGIGAKKQRWDEGFRRIPTLEETEPVFAVRGAMEYLYEENGYFGGHQDLDQIITLCEQLKLPARHFCDVGSPMNAASSYKHYYDFLDGGLRIFSGNYFFQERGAYVEGFQALRWILHNLEYAQPRKLKGEDIILTREELERSAVHRAGGQS